MKKILLIALTGMLALSSAKAAFTTSIVVAPGTMTNLLSLVNGSAIVKTYIFQAVTVASNAVVTIVDTPTNLTYFTNAAYTNRISYATNYIQTLTNFYGNVYTLTNSNPVLVDVTNNAVAATTNNYNAVTFAATTNATVTFQGINIYYDHGIWITNTGSGYMSVTATYIPGPY